MPPPEVQSAARGMPPSRRHWSPRTLPCGRPLVIVYSFRHTARDTYNLGPI